MLECQLMTSHHNDDSSQETRKHQATEPQPRPASDPERTQVNPRIERPADPSSQPTIRRERVERPPEPPPVLPVVPPRIPPAAPTQPAIQRRSGPPPRPKSGLPQKKRRKRGCLSQVGRGLLAVGIGLAVLLGVFALVYFIAPPPRTNVLILGVDARPGDGDTVRTDVMILATVDPRQPYVGMLSLPRDLWLDIPGYGVQRINAAHVFAEVDQPGTGPGRAMQTVADNFGVPVHRYMRVNFEGFVAIVDAAGGVTVDVEKYFIDYEYPTSNYGVMTIEFQPGTQHMDGERALQYARSRHGTGDNDRAARQQQIITALVKKMMLPINWWRLPAVCAAFARNVKTDLTLIDAFTMAPAILITGPNNFDRRVFDATMYYGTTLNSGAQVRIPIWEGINPVVDEMFRR